MRVLLAAAALYPVIAAAIPVSGDAPASPPAPTTIPLTRKVVSMFTNHEGIVDLDYVATYIDAVTSKYVNQGTKTIHSRAPSVQLKNHNHTSWTGEITLGTPPRKFTAMFDTGSSDVVVPTKSGCDGCLGHVYYDPSKSSSSKALKKGFSLTYGSGTVSGKQYADSITVAGLTAKGQTVLAADKAAKGFFAQMNALVGLSFADKSSEGVTPLVKTLRNEGKLHNAVFGFKLADSGSELTIGGTNNKLYKGNPTYVPVTSNKYWQVKFDKFDIWGESFKPDTTSAVIDSGTSLILADEKNVDSFYANVYGSQKMKNGMWSVYCYNIPDVNITFGGKNIHIPTDVFTLGQIAPESDFCLGGVQPAPLPFWVMGDVLMRNVYTVFDAAKKRVGFATLK